MAVFASKAELAVSCNFCGGANIRRTGRDFEECRNKIEKEGWHFFVEGRSTHACKKCRHEQLHGVGNEI